MTSFDDPNWRSPLTGSTSAQILALRVEHALRVSAVNIHISEFHRIAAKKRADVRAKQVEFARLEQEERDNAKPIRRNR